MKLLLRLIVSTIAVLVADLLLRGVQADTWQTGLAVAIVLGILNTFVRPLLIVLTLPVTVLTLGLFVLVINAGMVLLAARLIDGFRVDGFWWALLFSIVQWAVQGFLLAFDGGENKKEV